VRTFENQDAFTVVAGSGSTACLPTWYVSSSHGHRIVTSDGDQRWRSLWHGARTSGGLVENGVRHRRAWVGTLLGHALPDESRIHLRRVPGRSSAFRGCVTRPQRKGTRAERESCAG